MTWQSIVLFLFLVGLIALALWGHKIPEPWRSYLANEEPPAKKEGK